MKLYCEVVVQDVLPAVRSLITRELIDNYKMNQTDISKKLGVTQPAVSLYKKQMRGSKIKKLESDRDVMRIVRGFSKEIALKNIPQKEVQMKFLEISHRIVHKDLANEGGAFASDQLPCNICFKD